jgi:hypothetical protein
MHQGQILLLEAAASEGSLQQPVRLQMLGDAEQARGIAI